ncbi:unnamed protein product [Adineta steineri]|uniref:Uncharacterized protein n=1 Tax=Adineta steineri TaxID=433720 RepID=A0A815JHE0_9BILA|nr:unnamed protein product [Adineta steineri]CAF3778930.1 unnamed protein product [Adineta steineri]
MRVLQPSLDVYEALNSKYAKTLECPCTQISMNYDNFISASPIFHQVCSSDFVSDVWIRHLAMDNGSTFYGDDFQITGSHAFQALRMLCELAKNTLKNNFAQFYSSQYFSRFAIPEVMLQVQILSILNQLQSSMSDSFLLSFRMIRDTTQVNALFSALQINHKLYGSKDTGNIFVTANNYDGCSCSLSANCIRQSSIYNHNTMTKLFDVTGFYTGCNVIESLLQSTLECFYNQTCIDKLQNYLLPSPIPVSALDDSSSLSRYLKTTTINSLLSDLMEAAAPAPQSATAAPVEKWRAIRMAPSSKLFCCKCTENLIAGRSSIT